MNESRMACKRPCNACRMQVCLQKDCARWQEWFLDSWACVNRAAWAEMDALGRRPREKFCYDPPHMVKSPCDSCRCGAWCDTPCSLRIKWWDARMGAMRKRGGFYAAR